MPNSDTIALRAHTESVFTGQKPQAAYRKGTIAYLFPHYQLPFSQLPFTISVPDLSEKGYI
jgi:hypothetical protein